MYLQSEFHIQWFDYWVQLQAVLATPSRNNSQNRLESIGKPPACMRVWIHVFLYPSPGTVNHLAGDVIEQKLQWTHLQMEQSP